MPGVSEIPSQLGTLERFRQVRRALNLVATQSFRPYGIGPKQALILSHLSRNGAASMAELARLTETDPAATTRASGVLIRKGWVEVREDLSDGRKRRLVLSRAGQRQSQKIHQEIEKIERRMVAGLSAEDLGRFNLLLERVLASVNDGATRRRR